MLWYSWGGPRDILFFPAWLLSCAVILCCWSPGLESCTIFGSKCSVNRVRAVFISAHGSCWPVTCMAVLTCSGSSVGALDTMVWSGCHFPCREGEKPEQIYSPPPFHAFLSCSLLLPCPERQLALCLYAQYDVSGFSLSVFLSILVWFWLCCCRKASTFSLRYNIHLLIDILSCVMRGCQREHPLCIWTWRWRFAFYSFSLLFEKLFDRTEAHRSKSCQWMALSAFMEVSATASDGSSAWQGGPLLCLGKVGGGNTRKKGKLLDKIVGRDFPTAAE